MSVFYIIAQRAQPACREIDDSMARRWCPRYNAAVRLGRHRNGASARPFAAFLPAIGGIEKESQRHFENLRHFAAVGRQGEAGASTPTTGRMSKPVPVR